MNHVHRTLGATAVLFAAVVCGCSNPETGEHDSNKLRTERSEHDREGRGDHQGGESGEESGEQFARDQSYDRTRNGARLILSYDAESNRFKGTVENTTTETLARVRVEVHLSNGTELGPTTPADLGPGAKREVELAATDASFERWSAHPEVGNSEHEHGDEEHSERERGEHDREGRGEHRDE